MRLFSQFLFVFLFLASFAYAAGGGGQDFICFGYGDGKSKTLGTGFYKEGQTSNDDAGWCQQYEGGCYVNCVDPRNNGIENATESISGTPSIRFKDSDEARNLARFWCPVTSCYEPQPSSSYYQYRDVGIMCSQCGTRTFVRRPGGGEPEKPKEPEGPKDLIVEEINNIFGTGATPNTIYTRTTGSDLKVRMYHKDNSGSFGSGLNSATCTLFGSGTSISASGNWDFWSGGGAYIFEVKNGLSKAGYYNLQCSGVDKNNKTVVSPSMQFYVAPASYTAGLTINAYNGKSYNINAQKATSNGEIKKLSLGNDTIVQKVGSPLDITLSGSANTNGGSVDSGVNTSMQRLGKITNVIEGLNATSGTKVCQANAPTLPQTFTTKISSGNFNGNEKFSFDDVYKGKMTISYTDEEIKSKIEGEKKRGGCSSTGTNLGQCPFPPTFKFSFDYLIVPDNFEIQAITTKGSPIKVLYYGQGSSPANEGLVTLKVIPKGSANKTLKNFVGGCAAIDTELELKGADISIVFIDPTSATTSSTTTLIAAKDFTYQSNQSMANLQRVLKVQNTNNPWNPNMVAEPMKFGTSVTPLVYYKDKKNDNSYPQYTPSFDSLKDSIVLRGRVNMIDTDNAGDYSKPPTTKVYYEFYCQTCNLSDVTSVTGVSKYVGSPTSAGWWRDTTFDAATLKTNNISTTNNLQVSNVGGLANGEQSISYQNADSGKYEVMINHGSSADNFPTFLLYKPFHSGSSADGKTSAFVTIYKKIDDDNKDFGVDTGAGKNTRSGSRTGGF